MGVAQKNAVVYSRDSALISAHGDEKAVHESEPLEETSGVGRRVRSDVLQPQPPCVPPLQIAFVKYITVDFTTQRDLKPTQSNAGRRYWYIVNVIITYVCFLYAFISP